MFFTIDKRWMFLLLATFLQASASAIRLGFAAIMPMLKEALRLTPSEIGLAVSMLNLGAALGAIPSGKLADRFGERLTLTYGAILSGVLTVGVLAPTSFAGLAVLLLLIGMSVQSAATGGGKLIAGWFSPDQRATAMGIRLMGVPLGGAAAAALLPYLAIHTNWRVAVASTGVIAIAMGLAVWQFYKVPVVTAEPRPKVSSIPTHSLWSRPGLVTVFCYVFIFNGAQWCFFTYVVVYLTSTIGSPVVLAGTLFALAQIAGAIGRIVWGLVSDRIFNGRRKPALRIVSLGAIGLLLCLSLYSHWSDILLSVTVILLGFVLQGCGALIHVTGTEVAGRGAEGLSLGVTYTVGIAGGIVFPPLFGLIAGGADSYHVAWIALAVVIIPTLLVLPWLKDEVGKSD